MQSIKQGRAWRNFMKYKPLMSELVMRDLKVKYRRSFLGYVWSLLNPLMMMCVMAFIFSYIMPSQIQNFPLYLICGQTLWSFFNESTNMAMYSVLSNGSLIKKVYIPKFIFPISRILSSFVTMSFSLVAILIVMIFTRATFHWTILLFWIPLVFLFFFSCGIGLILSSMSVYFRDITHLYGVATMAWMYATPIFYDPSTMPAEVRNVIMINPLYHYVTFFRELVLYGTIPQAGVWGICILTSVISLAVGLLVFRKLQRNFIMYV